VKDGEIHQVIKILREEYRKWNPPTVTEVAKSRDPFQTLVSTIISLRTRDEVTSSASRRLFSFAMTPEDMVKLGSSEIEKLIFPAGFYRIKAKNIIEISKRIITDFGGKVPNSLDELLKLPGVGRKTANLVITLGYGKPGICVDTHVHRVSNRLGYVTTHTPHDTEFALRKKLPPEYWIEYNDLLVTFGQNLCTPLAPFCSKCRLYSYCVRKGVVKSR